MAARDFQDYMLANALYQVTIALDSPRAAVSIPFAPLDMFMHFTVMNQDAAGAVTFSLNSATGSQVDLPAATSSTPITFSNMNGNGFYLTHGAEVGKTLKLVFFGRGNV